MRARLVAVMVASLVLASSGGARAQEQDAAPAPYDATIDAAVAEFSAGRWQEARALFQQAHAIHPNARTLRGIGMASFELRDYPAALRALAAALREPRRPLTDEQRAQVAELRDRARAFVGRFIVPAAPEGTLAYVDGVRVELDGEWPAAEAELLLAVGAHEITLRASADRSASARVTVRGGEDGPLEMDLAPLAPPRREESRPAAPARQHVVGTRDRASEPSVAPWVVVGVGAGVMVVGAILLGVGAADIASVENAAAGTEWSDLADAHARGPDLTAAGGALLGVGAATAVIGLVWALVEGGGARDPDPLRVDVGPSGIELRGAF